MKLGLYLFTWHSYIDIQAEFYAYEARQASSSRALGLHLHEVWLNKNQLAIPFFN